MRSVRGGTGMVKTGGNYAAALKAQDEAHEQDYSQVLWLDGVERKYICLLYTSKRSGFSRV